MKTWTVITASATLAFLTGCAVLEPVGTTLQNAFTPTPEQAAQRQRDIEDESKPKTATVPDLKTSRHELPKFERVAAMQRNEVWCWAACAEMVHRYRGNTTVTQEKIVQTVQGINPDDPEKQRAGTYFEILKALEPAVPAPNPTELVLGIAVRVAFMSKGQRNQLFPILIGGAMGRGAQGGLLVDGDEVLVQALSSHQPAVVLFRGEEGSSQGHAMVAYACTTQPVDKSGAELAEKVMPGIGKTAKAITRDYKVVSVELYDPYTGQPVVMTGERFGEQRDHVLSPARARTILEFINQETKQLSMPPPKIR